MLKDTSLDVKLNNQDFPVTISAGQTASFATDHFVQAYTVIDLEADPDTSLELPYAKISYKAKAGRQVYISTDTHGFKDGTIKVDSGKIKVYSFQLVERIYPFECVGSFESNDPLLNRLWKVCARSNQVMSEDAYVDCSDRERTEWMDNTPPDFDVTRTAMAGPGAAGTKIHADRIAQSRVNDWADAQQASWDAAFYVKNAKDIVIQNCKISDAGISAINFDSGTQNSTITGCLIEHAGYQGVNIRGTGNTVSDCLIRYCGELRGHGQGVNLLADSNVLTNLEIYNIPRAGVAIGSKNNTVSYARSWPPREAQVPRCSFRRPYSIKRPFATFGSSVQPESQP